MLGRWKGLVVEGSGLETVCEDELWIWVGLVGWKGGIGGPCEVSV